MGREILFKAQRADTKEWVDGYPVFDFANCGLKRSRKCVCEHNGELLFFYGWIDELHEYGEIEVIPETICQYTGLTDKNGKKIFEGDIVRDIFNASVVGIVRYGDYRNTFNDDEYGGHVGFYIEWKKKRDLLRKDLMYWVKNSEFIGNIFDNPELLNQ